MTRTATLLAAASIRIVFREFVTGSMMTPGQARYRQTVSRICG
jgi:hypothetical protein